MEKSILDWMRKSGFTLEMDAAAAFRKQGFEVRQSTIWPDQHSSKGREIDVIAIDPDPRMYGIVEVSFVVECKTSTHPWVVLTSDDALRSWNRYCLFGVLSQIARHTLIEMPSVDGNLPPYLRKENRSGYSLRQAFSNKDADPAFSTSMGVIKACDAIVNDHPPGNNRHFAFAFPLIVVDTPLFECSLTADGDLQLAEVSKSEFLFTAHIPHEVSCCLSIVTKEGLPAYAEQAKQTAVAIRTDMKSAEDHWFDSVTSRNHSTNEQ